MTARWWERYGADLETHFNPQAAFPSFRAEFALRRERSDAFRAQWDVESDLRYGPGARQLLDVVHAGGPGTPMHIHVHGGYFQMGDKANNAAFAGPFARAGFPTILPTYDLCPAITPEAQSRQVLDAIRWALASAAAWGYAPRILLSGHSAGACHCAMALAHDWAAEGWVDGPFIGVVLLSGMLDLTPVPRTTHNVMLRMTEASAEASSPLYHPPRRPVPVLLACGSLEPAGWVEQSTLYAQRCRDAGCESESHLLEGDTHHTLIRNLSYDDHPFVARMLRLMR